VTIVRQQIKKIIRTVLCSDVNSKNAQQYTLIITGSQYALIIKSSYR